VPNETECSVAASSSSAGDTVIGLLPKQHARALAALDNVLKDNGWQLDKPNDPVTRLSLIMPGSAGDTSETAITYHKNIGGGSEFINCDLTIAISGDMKKGAIELTPFTCQKRYYSKLLRHYSEYGVG
jgi:hypothetical protein